MIVDGTARARDMWLLLFALAIALAMAWQASVPPPVRPADASPARFSAERAMADVREVGRRPHPAGSRDHARVAAVLIARMAELGLHPRIAAGSAVNMRQGQRSTAVIGADVRNIVGVLPGRDPAASAILLMAHYDSVPSSPGAADDGAGIATGLEIVRALRAGAPIRRDLILLFTDAEENGLLGARAFFAGDPAAARVGFVVNMDMRGGGGRAIMHETGQAAKGTIALYRRSAVRPTADSVAAWVERLLRNSSDFRIAADRGLPGLNYAILDRQFDYHAATSTPARLDARSLQHLGDEVLAAVAALLHAPALPRDGSDPAYASVLGIAVLSWPGWAGWLILAAAGLLAGISLRRHRLPIGMVAGGIGAALHLLLCLLLALTLARSATDIPFGFTEGRALLAKWRSYEVTLALVSISGVLFWRAGAKSGAWRGAATVPLLLLVALLLSGAGSWPVAAIAGAAVLLAVAYVRPLPAEAAACGLFGLVAASALAAQAVAPSATPSAMIALLGGAMVLLLASGRTWPLALAGAVLAGLLVAQHLATAHLLLLAVGETTPAIAAPFAIFAALALAPLMAVIRTGRLALVGAVGAAGATLMLLLIRFGDAARAETPAPSQVVHVSDLASGRFYRVTSLRHPDAWTRAVLGPAAKATLTPLFDHAFVSPGEVVQALRPTVALLHQADGSMLLRVPGLPGTREIHVALAATVPLRNVRANGHVVPLLHHAGRIYHLGWSGREPGLSLRFVPDGPGRLVMRTAFLADGWPRDARPLPPRLPTVMPWYESDTHVVLHTSRFVWER